MQDGTGSDDGTIHGINTESFERASLKVLEQAVASRLKVEHPVVHLLREVVGCGCFGEVLAVAMLDEHLLRLKIA